MQMHAGPCCPVGAVHTPTHHDAHKPEPQLVQQPSGPAVVDEGIVLHPAAKTAQQQPTQGWCNVHWQGSAPQQA
jgi:hypothetical protein